MPTLLPKDADNNAIPALGLRAGGSHAITAGASSTRNATAFNAETRVVNVIATVPVYIEFGDISVAATANSHYFPAGVYYGFDVGGGKSAQKTHMAVLQVSSGGNVYISEME